MTKFFKFLTAVLAFAVICVFCYNVSSSANASVRDQISNKYIYFFYQSTCPHCHHASAYIRKKYPRLKMVNLDVKDPDNYNLFLKCAQKFHLSQNTLGTPLICMGNNYIMGWSDMDEPRFDTYVKAFR